MHSILLDIAKLSGLPTYTLTFQQHITVTVFPHPTMMVNLMCQFG